MDSRAAQLVAAYPQAFAVMSQNAPSFLALAGQQGALQLFAANAQAFAVLGHDSNFQALVTDSAFAAAARSQGFANAFEQ
jgi:hypothetical protein